MIHTPHLKINKKIDSREREREGKKEGENHRCDDSLGIKPGTFGFVGEGPNNLSHTIQGRIPGHKEGNSCSTHLRT